MSNEMSGTTVSTWTVTGMTCQHCVASVSEELAELDGVQAVAVDLESGAVSITSSVPLERAAVDDAVTEAGYALG